MGIPGKCNNILQIVRDAMKNGLFRYTSHAKERMVERNITHDDVKEVAISGWWEKKKDKFQKEHNEWNYAIRGKVEEEEREVRIIVAQDANNVLLITAIDLGGENEQE